MIFPKVGSAGSKSLSMYASSLALRIICPLSDLLNRRLSVFVYA